MTGNEMRWTLGVLATGIGIGIGIGVAICNAVHARHSVPAADASVSGKTVEPEQHQERLAPEFGNAVVHIKNGQPTAVLRDGPSRDALKLGELPEGTTVQIITVSDSAKTGRWLNVRTSSGTRGWMHQNVIQMSPQSTQ